MTIYNGTLQVPGANIHYQARGTGPIILLVHGGGGDADKFHHVANHLANWYTVVTYDRRGHSRSNLAHQVENYRVETHSDDAHRLLAKITNKPAYVFGSSSGAVIGLDLCIRHPEQVRVMISHEPILLQLLHGNELKQAEQFMEDLKKNHRGEVTKLIARLEIDEQSKNVLTKRLLGNSTYFTDYEIQGILNYTLDIEALKTVFTSASVKIIPAGGSASRELFPYRCANALAEHLETELVEFPGNHTGYTMHHKEFSERLHDMLEKNKHTG
ncbi:hydrolase [Bacillus sp. A053]|uniref:alpha/beta fold hydrolase n=1 Tax=Bacillus TaxID=1386 RepID=UPI000589F198|nr:MULTISPECIES: alpha/beta fold hydrolase [Bacillus]ASB61785.1 alpha/beta hydrolase [Bacillus sp. MD-5]KIH41989.1 hydrolase [Bacillus sp. A053]MDL9994710.1 alpha/beta fold hydrolase [Bacillus stercoris]